MKIISCDHCAVMIDAEKLKFPNIYKDDGTIDIDKACWDGDDYRPAAPCPNCGGGIQKPEVRNVE